MKEDKSFNKFADLFENYDEDNEEEDENSSSVSSSSLSTNEKICNKSTDLGTEKNRINSSHLVKGSTIEKISRVE